MALLWMDGFDHYGTIQHMVDGAWAQVGPFYSLDVTNPRTGIQCLRHNGAAPSTSTDRFARRVFGAALESVGVGGVVYLSVLPSLTQSFGIFMFRDITNVSQVTIWVETDGTIKASRGDAKGVLLGSSAAPAVTASAYQHVEAKVRIHPTAGTVEVRVNGVTVLNLTGQNTQATGLGETSQVCVIGYLFTTNTSASHGTVATLDDLYAWDTSGTRNNDFLGDRRVRTIFPDADTATENWTATGATDGFDCINDPSPDDETTYISALPLTGSPPTPLVSIYGLQNPPAGIGSIAAVQTCLRMRKTEAGATNVQVSMLSSGGESAGADRPITEVYTYWMDVHELNPNTGTPWSESSLSAAQLQIKRTA